MKKQTLADKLRESPPCIRGGNPTWYEKMRSENPKLLSEIDAVIDCWIAGDESIVSRCARKLTLAKWIEKNAGGIPAKQDAIARYITKRAEQHGSRG